MVNFVKQDMTNIWAELGDYVAPDASKITQGWLVEVVPRQYWNWIENRQDKMLAYLSQKGIPEWDSTTEYIINKSYVQHNNIVYKCIQTGTNKDPSTQTAYWKKAFTESNAVSEAVSGLTPAADRYVYFTGATTAATGTITSFARSILDDADATTVRATIGAQQADATLTALAGLATDTNKLPYFTGVDVASVTDLSAFGRSLIDDATATDARTTLGLGTVSTQDANSVEITGGSITGITDLAIADGGTGSSTAAGARTNLGLGSAATLTSTTSTTDATAGRALRVGDFGVGVGLPVTTADLNTLTAPGLYYTTNASPVNYPSTYNSGLILVIAGGATNVLTQVFYPIGEKSKSFHRTFYLTWGAWTESLNTGNQLLLGTTPAAARTTLELGTAALDDSATAATASTVVKRGTAGQINASRLNIGDATDSSTVGINYSESFGANQSSYGVNSAVYTTDATLTADRALAGGQFLAEQNVNSAEAFSISNYGIIATARSGTTGGGWSITGEGAYYGVNAIANYQSTDATNKYVNALYGVRGQAQVNTSAAAVIANAYAFHANVQNLTAGATITNGYGLYLAYTTTGTITNKWSIYSSSSAWVGYHAGEMRIGGSATQTPRGTLDVVGDIYYDSIALGSTSVNVDNLTANGVITNVTSSTTGTFNVFQPKTGTLVTYTDGTHRSQIHYPDTGYIWARNKVGSSAWSAWTWCIQNDHPGLIGGSCTFNGNGGITVLRNTANLGISRSAVGTYVITSGFGLNANQPVVAMTNTNGRVTLTTAAGAGGSVTLTVYGYNNATATDTSYLNVILGN